MEGYLKDKPFICFSIFQILSLGQRTPLDSWRLGLHCLGLQIIILMNRTLTCVISLLKNRLLETCYIYCESLLKVEFNVLHWSREKILPSFSTSTLVLCLSTCIYILETRKHNQYSVYLPWEAYCQICGPISI